MSYIIIWRNNHREPFVEQTDNHFLNTYSSYEDAQEAAENTIENEGPKSQWYFNYKIYEEATS